jgi:hypothetical protein
MSDPEIFEPDKKASSDDEPSKGVSLTLLYSIIAFALAAAIALAAMIVWPFYKSR